MKSAPFTKLFRAAVLTIIPFIAASLRSQTDVLLYRPDPNDHSTAPQTSALLTRKFQLDPTKFKDVLPLSGDIFSPQQQMRAFLSEHGLNFTNSRSDTEPSWTEPGEIFFYNDRLATLWIRAPRDKIDKASEVLRPYLNTFQQIAMSSGNNTAATLPQINLVNHFVEFSDADAKKIGLDGSLFEQIQGPKFTYGGFSTNANVSTNRIFKGILTEPQFRIALRSLETAQGVDILTGPPVTTLSGRRARLSVEESPPPAWQTPPPQPRDTAPDADPTPATYLRKRQLIEP